MAAGHPARRSRWLRHRQHLLAGRPGVARRCTGCRTTSRSAATSRSSPPRRRQRQRRGELPPRMVNSLIVASATMVISWRSACSVATRSPGCGSGCARTSLLLFLAIYMLPPIALVIPLYLVLVSLHLLDTQARADHRLLLVRHAVLPVDDEQLLPQPPARPRGGRPGGRVHPARGAVPGHPAAGPAGPAHHGDVRLPAGLGRVPLRPDLHLHDQRQDDPGGDRRVHRQVLLRLRPASPPAASSRRCRPCCSRCCSSATSSAA